MVSFAVTRSVFNYTKALFNTAQLLFTLQAMFARNDYRLLHYAICGTFVCNDTKLQIFASKFPTPPMTLK